MSRRNAIEVVIAGFVVGAGMVALAWAMIVSAPRPEPPAGIFTSARPSIDMGDGWAIVGDPNLAGGGGSAGWEHHVTIKATCEDFDAWAKLEAEGWTRVRLRRDGWPESVP